MSHDGEPLGSGVSVCARCGKDRLNALALAFLKLELNAVVESTGQRYAQLSPELHDWLRAQ